MPKKFMVEADFTSHAVAAAHVQVIRRGKQDKGHYHLVQVVELGKQAGVWKGSVTTPDVDKTAHKIILRIVGLDAERKTLAVITRPNRQFPPK